VALSVISCQQQTTTHTMNIEESDYEKKKVLRVINNTKQTELSLNTRLKNTYAVLDSQRIFRR